MCASAPCSSSTFTTPALPFAAEGAGKREEDSRRPRGAVKRAGVENGWDTGGEQDVGTARNRRELRHEQGVYERAGAGGVRGERV